MPTKLKTIYVRCNDSEFEQLNKKAEIHNLSISRYLVECGLSDNAYLSPHLRKRIDQIKYEAKLLQDNVDLLLNKKSYLEQLLAVGELNNFIFFLTSAAKRLHNIFLVDNNQTSEISINQFDKTQTYNNQIDNPNQIDSNHIGEVNTSPTQRLSDNDTSKDSNGSNSSSSAFENKKFGDAQINTQNANSQNAEIKTTQSNSSYSAPISIATLECYVEENVEVVLGFTSATNFFFFYHHECVPTLSTDIQDINTTNLDDEILANCISLESDVYASGNSSGVDHNLVVATLPINSTNGNQISLSDTNLDNSFNETSINESLESLTSENLINGNLINGSLVSQTSTLEVETQNLDHKILIIDNSESTTATTVSNPSLETENSNQLNMVSPVEAPTPITWSNSNLANSNQLNVASLINASSTTTATTELNQLNVLSPIGAYEKSNYDHSHSREDNFNNNNSSYSNDEDESSSSPLDGELDGELVETKFYVVDDGSIDPNLPVYLPVDNSYYEEPEELEENKQLDNSALSISDPNTQSLEVPTATLDTPTQEHLQENLSDQPYEEEYDFLTQSEEEFNAEWDRIYKLIQQTDFSSVDLNSPVILPFPIDDSFDNYSLDNSNNSDKKELALDNNIITSNTDNNLSSSSQACVADPTNKDFP